MIIGCLFLTLLHGLTTVHGHKQLTVPKSFDSNFPYPEYLAVLKERTYRANRTYYAWDINLQVNIDDFDQIKVSKIIKTKSKGNTLTDVVGVNLQPICEFLKDPKTLDLEKTENWFPQCPVGRGLWGATRLVPVSSEGFYNFAPKNEKIDIILEMYYKDRKIGCMDFGITIVED